MLNLVLIMFNKEENKEESKDLVGHCEICMDDIPMDDLHCLDVCSHLFHKE